MPLSMEEQMQVAMRSVTEGDVDLLSTMLTDPNTVSLDEQRTVAQRLGIKRGLLSAMVNTFSDPVVWITYLMSRAFPTAAYLKGTIPKSFVGAANEFSGMSLIGRPVEGYFRGSNISRLNALAVQRQQKALDLGNRTIFEVTGRRPNWADEKEVVSLLMEGQPHGEATPELRRVAVQLREGMNGLWGLLSKAQRVTGGFGEAEISRAVATPFARHQAPQFLRDYLPHIPLVGNESIMELSGRRALDRMVRGPTAQAIGLKGENPAQVWNAGSADRLASDFTRYQQFMGRVGSEIYNPYLMKRTRHDIPLQSAQGQQLFVTDLDQILQKYVHSVAKTYATNTPISNFERQLATQIGGTRPPTNEPIVVQIINEGLDSSLKPGMGFAIRPPPAGTNLPSKQVLKPDSFNQPMVSSLKVLVQNLQGTGTLEDALFGQMFNGIRNETSRALGAFLPGRRMNQVNDGIQAIERTRSFRNKSNAIASYFYSTTLGLNPWSAMQNMLQPILTTVPAIGIGPTLKGYAELKRRLPGYASAVVRKHQELTGSATINRARFGTRTVTRLNEATELAFKETFPELQKLGFKIDPRLFEIDVSAIKAGKFGSYDEYAKFLLQPFTQAELSNQVVTFFGGKHALKQAMKTGEYVMPKGLNLAQQDQLLNFEAGMLVNATQFRPGPGSRTYVQSMLPAPFRQFTSFPVRLFNFYAESTVRGAMTEQQLASARVLDLILPTATAEARRLGGQKLASLGTGRNVGTVARSLLAGRIVTNGFRDVLGVDVGGALGLTAPFQNLAPDQPFAPLPLPPIASTVYGLASYASTRDLKDMQPMRLPVLGEVPVPKTLVPGGIGISRAVKALQQYRPDMGGFVDDQERLMYKGGTTDLILSALGIPLDKSRRTRNAVDRVYANRTAIRDFRRRYAVAAMGYDYAGMDELQQKFAKAFPDMPALTLSHKDLRRYRQNAAIPMLSRMLNTMGKNAAFLERDIYEFDPDLIAPPALDLAG